MMSSERVFPCDCCGEGIVTTVYFCEDDNLITVTRDGKLEDAGAYYIELSFWGQGHYGDGRLNWIDRLRLMWYVWRHGHPWTDMVMMTPDVAKSFANHLLYRVGKIEKKIDMKNSELKGK